MFVVTVLYAAGESLDMGYYRDRHIPLVRHLLEPAGMQELTYWQPAADDEKAPYQLVAELRFDDRKTGSAALAAHGAETQADIANFTTITPLIMTGETAAV